MRALILSTALALASLASAQVFTSGFENWTDTLPDGWVGVKTNISLDSIEQVSTNPHSGVYAVRLYNAPTSTKRFSTQPLATDSLQSYDISYWVRGQGDVRVAIFDGRTENNGYSPNGPYTTVNSTEWTQQTATLICDHDNAAAEFIFYVRNTTAPDRIVIDDVNITTGAVVEPTAASIYQIQSSVDGGGGSTYAGLPVITGGIVTGVDTIGADSYFIQAGSGAWSGVYVYDQANQPSIGDSIVLTATVVEFQGVTELSNVTAYNTVGQYPVPTPQLLDTYGATLEQWEGVLAVIANATCTALPNGFGEWNINQPSGDLLVDDLMFPYLPEMGSAYDVTGCVHYANGAWKIEPRFIADIATATGVEETAFAGMRVFPNPAVNELNIRLPELNGRADYQLTDITGRVVASGNITNTTTMVAVSGVAGGSYQLIIRGDEGMRTSTVQVR